MNGKVLGKFSFTSWSTIGGELNAIDCDLLSDVSQFLGTRVSDS